MNEPEGRFAGIFRLFPISTVSRARVTVISRKRVTIPASPVACGSRCVLKSYSHIPSYR